MMPSDPLIYEFFDYGPDDPRGIIQVRCKLCGNVLTRSLIDASDSSPIREMGERDGKIAAEHFVQHHEAPAG